MDGRTSDDTDLSSNECNWVHLRRRPFTRRTKIGESCESNSNCIFCRAKRPYHRPLADVPTPYLRRWITKMTLCVSHTRQLDRKVDHAYSLTKSPLHSGQNHRLRDSGAIAASPAVELFLGGLRRPPGSTLPKNHLGRAPFLGSREGGWGSVNM